MGPLIKQIKSPFHVKNDEGQAAVEYILLVAIVTAFFVALMNMVTQSGLMKKLLTPIQKDYAQAYKNGHPQALGFDDAGGPKKHPRVITGEDNFRIFYVKPK